MSPDRPDPILLAPPRVVSRGGSTVRGRGAVTATLGDGAEVIVRVPATVAYAWAGTGAVRVPRPDVRVFAGASGRLEVRGDDLVVEIVRGEVRLDLVGVFDVVVDARGEVRAGDGARFPGRGAGRCLRVDGARVSDADARPRAGGAAA